MVKRISNGNNNHKRSNNNNKFENNRRRNNKSTNGRKYGKKNSVQGRSRQNNNMNNKFKKQKVIKKEKSLKEQENDINDIEAENLLFDSGNTYYRPKDDEDDQNEEEWTNDNNEVALNILDQLNQVRETKLDPRIHEAYTLVGDILSKYTSGKLPKAFNILPTTENWEELIALTNPLTWSPQAMFEATKLFSSNLNAVLAERFYQIVLLPAIRYDIANHKKLNIHYYKCLKKALFKPAAFFKGLIVPLAEKASLKECTIIGSILRICSIPVSHASAAVMKLIDDKNLRFNMSKLYFLKLLLSKKYALPTMVKEELVKYFSLFIGRNDLLPVLWHQALLIFVQIYKNDLTDPEKQTIKKLVQKQKHHQISEEIIKELNYVSKNLQMFVD